MNDATDRTPLLITEAEAAKMLAICPKSVWTLAARGDLPFIKIGTSKRYAVADLEAFIARVRQEGGGR